MLLDDTLESRLDQPLKRTNSWHAVLPARTTRRLLPAALLATSLVASVVALAQVSAATPWWVATPGARPSTVAPSTVTVAATPDATDSPKAGAAASSQPARLDALSPELAAYVARQGNTMGVAIYDITRNRSYAYNATTTFTLASSAKVYILCAYLDMIERQRRAPTAYERTQMSKMIEDSDNNAAQWLYNRIGQQAGQARYLASIGISDYTGHGYDWGWATLSPTDMVHILTLLQTGQILSAGDRAYALSLMGKIDLGHWGVGDTAPRGAVVYMKDGWVTGPDGKWAQNSSGIVVTGHETYIISVYMAHQPRYDWSKIQHVCGEVAGLLTAE